MRGLHIRYRLRPPLRFRVGLWFHTAAFCISLIGTMLLLPSRLKSLHPCRNNVAHGFHSELAEPRFVKGPQCIYVANVEVFRHGSGDNRL